MNSFGFFKRSKFHVNQHPKSVSKGNTCTIFAGIIMLGSSSVVSLCPLQFLLFPQMIEHCYKFGCFPSGCLLPPAVSDWEGCREMREEEGHLLRSIISDPRHAINWHLPPGSPFADSYQGRSYSLLAGCHSSFQPVCTDIPGTNTGTGGPQRQLQFLDHLRCFQQAPFVISTALLLCYQKPTNLERAGSATWH